MSFGTNNKDRTQWQLERVGGYDKHGHVFSIARPLTGSVSFPVKTFPSTAALEQFINEYTFFRYRGRCPTWRSVLNKSDCFSGEERDTGTLKGKNYTPEGGKDYVIQLISSGELVVHRTGSWIPSQDRNHHLPWPKSATKKEEFLPPSRTTTLGPHEEPGYEPPPWSPVELKTSGDMRTTEDEDAAPNKPKFANLRQMDQQYVGEETGAVWGTKVKYLDDVEKRQYQLHIKNGKIYDAEGKLFDTSDAKSAFGGEGNAIFVMDKYGSIYASVVHSPG
ncbi:hypothetical protein MNBD_GAMMA19-1689, partial [hydrothermal vent metagenome]